MKRKSNKKVINTKSKPISKRRKNYALENVELALKDIRSGKSIAECSRVYGIPESTLRDKKYNIYSKEKPGPSTILSESEENEIVEWIIECCEKGFPVTKNQLLASVEVICLKTGRKNSFKNNKPGRHWFENFMKRHPEISKRLAENVSLNRAKVSDLNIQKWFSEVHVYLKSKNLLDVDASRVFNCDETGLYIIFHVQLNVLI